MRTHRYSYGTVPRPDKTRHPVVKCIVTPRPSWCDDMINLFLYDADHDVLQVYRFTSDYRFADEWVQREVTPLADAIKTATRRRQQYVNQSGRGR